MSVLDAEIEKIRNRKDNMNTFLTSIGQAASLLLGYVFTLFGPKSRGQKPSAQPPTAVGVAKADGTELICVPAVESTIVIPEISVVLEPFPAQPAVVGPTVAGNRRMTLAELCEVYFTTHERIVQTADANTKCKRLTTLRNERGHMDAWLHLFGGRFIDKLDERSLAQYCLFRRTTEWPRQYYKKDGSPGKLVKKIATGATIDLSVITAGNVFKFAVDMGLLPDLPFERVKRAQQLSKGPKVRALVSVEHVMAILDEAVAPVPPGIPALMGANAPRRRKQLRNYLAFLAFSGARRAEATMLRWEDVQWPERHLDGEFKGQFKRAENGQLLCGRVRFGPEIQKNSHGYTPEERWIEFNDELEALLLEMYQEKEPDAVYLFPALPGDNRKRLNKLQKLVIRKAYQTRFDSGLTNVLERLKVKSKDGTKMVSVVEYYGQEITLHHLRVFFISEAVMAGVDLVTIAKWVGHKSTVMIEEIYARLALEHRAAQARQLKFRPHQFKKGGSKPQLPGDEPPQTK
jgi:integrase